MDKELKQNRHSCSGKNLSLKAGVSLIAVLLFMLVATIAATATYKWLTSEGRSSASRMQQQEAYQSAVAGIESARSWMTYNANETGAIIKQYKDGNNAPVKLTDRLAAFVRAGQHYDVYLVGVNTENKTYKLKLLSEGTSRNGNAKHSEVAVLNVNGLYQVKVPVAESHGSIEFDFNYFGGSTQAQGHVGARSMLINGNLTGSNPVYAQTDLIVTGNVEMSGNSVGADGTVCVGGNLEASNGVFGNSFYVEGDARHFSWPSASEAKNTFLGETVDKYTLTGDVYINGNLEAPSTGGQIFPKNLSLNGTWTTNLEGYESSVLGDLCLGDTGFVYMNKLGRTFGVGQNVWMPGNVTKPGNISFWKGDMSGTNCSCNRYLKTCKKTGMMGMCIEYEWTLQETGVACTGSSSMGNYKNVVQNCDGNLDLRADDDNWGQYEKIFLGQKADSKVYIKRAHTLAEYKAMREEKSFTTTATQIQSCESDNCVSNKKWKSETLTPYKDQNKPANKPNPNYIYYMPAGYTDIDYGSYFDDYWNVDVYGFFLNFATGQKNKDTRFTDPYNSHSTCPAEQPILRGGKCYSYLNVTSNDKITGSPYCKLKPTKQFSPECGVAPWFASNGTVTNVLPAEKPFPCADTVKTYCLGKLGERKTGCDGASYKVDDLLRTAYDTFVQYANRGCRDVTTWTSDLSSKLNTCYSNNTSSAQRAQDSLYNGYQVVKVTDNGMANPRTELNGKFIIIVTNTMGQQALPPTTADSYVFLYMLGGGRSTIQPADEGNGHKYNYFIYTEESVTSGGSADAGFMFNNDVLSGSIYARAENCANVQNFKARKLEYNSDLLRDLQDNSILCDYKETTCGGSPVSSSSAGSSASADELYPGGYDNFYISVAPQLSVTLESQYKNAETVATAGASEVEGSFIVLPRIIYLPKDAKGRLDNYYNIVPLNAASPVTSASVTCDGGLPTSGKLVPGDVKLSEGDYSCKVVGTVQTKDGAAQKTVPFWVRVKGEGGDLPVVSFVETMKEVSKGSSTPVALTLPTASGGGTQTCQVEITVSGDISDWEVAPATGVTSNGSNVYSATVSSEAPLTVFNVTNTNSDDGSIYLTITDADACSPGAPAVLFNANTAPIERLSIAQYCTDNSSDAGCASGGTYDDIKGHPDCNEAGEWVTVNGTGCSISETNDKWKCAVSGSISLKKVKDVPGCEVVIAPVTYSAPLEANKTPPYYLYASLKKVPMTFHTGFSVEGSLDGDRTVKVRVTDETGSRETSCSYSDFMNDDLRSEKCDIMVYHGSIVTLSLEPEDPADFNYWVCESGLDCPSDDAHPGLTYQISVTSEDVVYAHFGENDKHCFFDEFKEPTRGSGYRHNRDYIFCGHETDYCIDYCESDGNSCISNLGTSSYPNAKWRFMSLSTATKDDLDYSVTDGRIALKSSATRGRKESEKRAAVIMSSVQAGLYGTLKAQFQLPREGVSAGDIAGMTTHYSGFILRSNTTVSSFLLLNVFTVPNGEVHARLCLDGNAPCLEESLKRNGSAYRPADKNALVLMAATLKAEDGHDVLQVDLYSSAWTNEPYTTTFVLTDNNISGVTATATRPNEYVGYILSDQNFKIYGIGWKSDSYRSECWDTYPTLSCSFKAAYPTGIVPKGESTKPWVGFSAWFDAVAGGCQESDIGYYYKGDDACGGTGTTYNNCGSSYTFSQTGAHGYMEGDVERRMAKVDVATSCNVYGEEASWARGGVAANCGSFWVGDINACSRHHNFDKTATGDEGEYFGLESGTANLREANLKVNLDNPDGKKIEVYMFSLNNSSGYTYGSSHLYSLPYQTKKSGTDITIDIPVRDLINSEGFDPENVVGVYVKTFNESSVIVNSVMSSCPNAVEIKNCSATYENGGWKIIAEVKNSANTKKIDVEETHSYITSPSSLECEKESTNDDTKCKFTGDNAEFKWADNPFASHADDTYSFKITLTSKENTTSECTATGSVNAIEATCGAISAATAIQGRNIPQFTYSISNCPDNACGFKIDLKKNGSVVKNITTRENSGNVTSTQTSATAANGSSDQLDEGTYKFALVHTNDDRPFTDCESAEFVVNAPGSISADCEFSGVVVKGGSATLQMTSIENVDANTTITIAGPGGSSTTETLTANATSKNVTITAPDAANTYTYTVNYTANESTKKICDASLTVVDGLGCSASTAAITLGESFTFTPTYGGSCTSASLAGNGTISGSGCDATSFTVTPNATGDQTYTYTFSGSIGSNLTCSKTVTVTPPVPSFDCPSPAMSGTLNNAITMTLRNVSYCDDGCTMRIDEFDGTGASDYKTFANPRTFTDASATTSTTSYTIHLKNGTGDASKSCPVTYTSSDCATVTWNLTGNNSNGNAPSPALPWAKGCATITMNRVCLGEVQIKASQCKGKRGTWNGVAFRLDNSDLSYYRFATNPAPALVNEINIDDCDNVNTLYMTDCQDLGAATSVPTISGCPTETIVKSPNSTVNVPITFGNCQVIGGCTYTVSKDGSSGPETLYYGGRFPLIAGDASGEHEFVVSIRNSKGEATAPCSFKVRYDSYADIDIDFADGAPHDIEVGKKYVIASCNSSVANIKCDANGGGHELWAGADWDHMTRRWTSYDWQNLTGNYQSAGGICSVGLKITAEEGMVRCVNDN